MMSNVWCTLQGGFPPDPRVWGPAAPRNDIEMDDTGSLSHLNINVDREIESRELNDEPINCRID